ncbi:MAG: autotransporter adhesin family protein [Spirochaetaceae bacterium]|nr:autotransporter adhesin family protein [Spirochaetaceae bacterium]
MKKFYSSPGTFLLMLAGALGTLGGCDAFNAPLKEEIDYHLSLHPVKNGAELAAAIGAVPSGGSGTFAIITGIVLTDTIIIDNNKTITLEAYAGNSDARVIRRAAGFTGPMFEVQSGGKLVLGGGRDKENLALDGEKRSATGSLVTVTSGGALVLNSGAELRNNSRTGGPGGGVSVFSSGSFTMNGGSISENTSTNGGGGVYISGPGSSFVMNGGSISGNTSNYGGGGVYVNGGSFAMNGGSISGNTSIIYGGGGVYVPSSGGSITISGSAEVNTNNPVYLPSGKTITLTGPLSANPAANIIPQYPSGAQLLTNNAFLMAGSPANYTRFLVNGAPGKINASGIYVGP